MNKHFFLIAGFTLLSLAGFSQSSTKAIEQTLETTNNLYLGLGGVFSTFQDVKYSTVKYGGIGAAFDIGFNKKKENRYSWEAGFVLNYAKASAKTHDSGKTQVFNPTLYFTYLKTINSHLSIGGRWDILDFYFRSTAGLGNNSSYYINGSHLYGTVAYQTTLAKKWSLQVSADVGLFSFMRESTSFGFSAPQNALENGEFNYQNSALESPFGFKYFQFKHLFNNLNLRTAFMFSYKKRIALGYQWHIRHFANVKSYPVTTGMHRLIFRYNIRHKEK